MRRPELVPGVGRTGVPPERLRLGYVVPHVATGQVVAPAQHPGEASANTALTTASRTTSGKCAPVGAPTVSASSATRSGTVSSLTFAMPAPRAPDATICRRIIVPASGVSTTSVTAASGSPACDSRTSRATASCRTPLSDTASRSTVPCCGVVTHSPYSDNPHKNRTCRAIDYRPPASLAAAESRQTDSAPNLVPIMFEAHGAQLRHLRPDGLRVRPRSDAPL